MADEVPSTLSPALGQPTQYIQSYGNLEVQKLMLQDVPRTEAYKNFISENLAIFKDKIVIDLGAGTGILSLFIAKCSPKKVYAVEASGMSHGIDLVAAANGYQDVIHVVHGEIEQVEIPEKVDVIISEWMGFYLLHESMLSSVIYARENFLKPGGLIFPSTASIYICPINAESQIKERFDYWLDVYGFDLSPLLSLQDQSAPVIDNVARSSCLAEKQLVSYFDLNYVAEDDFKKINGNFTFKAQKNGILNAYALWFSVDFAFDNSVRTLSTGPCDPTTHWKQTILILPDAYLISKDEDICCQLLIEQSENPRLYNLSLCIEEDEETEGACTDAKAALMNAVNEKYLHIEGAPKVNNLE